MQKPAKRLIMVVASMGALLAAPFPARPSPAPLQERAVSGKALLAELEAVLECRPSRHSQGQLLAALLADPGIQSSPLPLVHRRAWIGVRLPVPITVFGQQARDVVVVEGGDLTAILPDVAIAEVIAANGLQAHRSAGKNGVWIKPVAWRPIGTGRVEMRVQVAVLDWSSPGRIQVGCGIDEASRTELRASVGLPARGVIGPHAHIGPIIRRVLSCRGNAQESAQLQAALMTADAQDARFEGWSSTGGAAWTLPRPVQLDGAAVSVLWLVNGGVVGVIDNATSVDLSARWMLEAREGPGGDGLYTHDLPTTQAEDGWAENRTRFVRHWKSETWVTGCEYAETYPERGWWPEEQATR